MTRVLLLFILILPVSLYAQKRKKNVIKPLCMASDYMAEEGNTPFTFAFSFEYERQFSPRVSVNLSYHKFMLNNEGMDYSQAPRINYYSFRSADYKEEFSGFGYESRFYFNDFELDGISSGYVSFMYQFIRVKQTLTNAWYEDQMTGDRKSFDFPQEHFSIHRPGIRFGHVWQGVLYSDLYFGAYYNVASSFSANKIPPHLVDPLSLVIGWNIGIPF